MNDAGAARHARAWLLLVGALAAHVLDDSLCAIGVLNGLGHLAGSVYFQRWLPGATTAPLLLAAGLLLARAVWARGRAGATPARQAT